MTFQKAEFYQSNIKDTQSQINQLSSKINRYALLRLAVILVGGIALFQVIQSQQITLTLVTFFIILILFFWLVAIQSKLAKEKEALDRFLRINDNEVAVSKSRTNNIYNEGAEFVDDRHLYSSDLDIFGESSLFQLINRSATVGGIRQLADWLLQPSQKREIDRRQEFVDELVVDFAFWQNIQSQLLFAQSRNIDYKKMLLSYLAKPIAITAGTLLRGYVRIVPYVMMALFIGSFFSSKVLAAFIIVALFNFAMSFYFGGKVNQISSQVNKAGEALTSFSSVFKSIEQKQWKSSLAIDLLKRIESQTRLPVSGSIRDLSTLVSRLDLRLNMFLGMLLNVFLLWDLKQVFALEEWKRSQSAGIAEAFDLLSAFEAIGSLATLKFNNPTWIFPQIDDTQNHVLECEQIAHPFISQHDVVSNNYSLADHRLALITGSNMAGKSTFLRTLGINAVLAYAGAPVYATSMKISVMQMVTYMRIRDSLNESTSTFKAELDRITQVLEEVEVNKNTFFLLDEMLRGTNSVDKYLGSKAIIEKLISKQGVGMVATHDLKLADLSEIYPEYVKNYHFDIQVHGEEMLFDYLLKNGPCTIFNASLLLKKIGIHI